MMEDQKGAVRAFWETEACGERYGAAQDTLRYQMEPEILSFADFGAARGQRVLEIGVGMGSDFLRWLRAGAVASGVDLTRRAAELTRQRTVDEGLRGNVCVADAEALPYPSDVFDVVYSWGVLHHTPNPARAMREAQRVLACGGRLKIMLYHRHSWVAAAAWARFCLARGHPRGTLAEAVASVESPGTRAFLATEVAALLPGLADLSVRPILTRWDRKYAPIVASIIGDRFGWFLLIEGSKPRPSVRKVASDEG